MLTAATALGRLGLSGCLVLGLGLAAEAQTLLASRTIRAQALIGPEDIALSPDSVPGALSDPTQALGLEARVVLYAGRPIRPGDLGPPAVIDRNQIVALRYNVGRLVITTEGRALGRAGVGETVRVMNLDSRTTVTGRVSPEGNVDVANRP